MKLYPNGYFSKVSEIKYEYLKENNIKALALDVDNTLIDYYENIEDSTIEWAKGLKDKGIKLCILSNSNKEKKVKKVADKLEIEYINWAMKPLKRGFKKIQKLFNINNNEIAVVGDQIFTDIIGANRMKMFSILVDPINEKDIWVTKIKRPIERYIKKKCIKN